MAVILDLCSGTGSWSAPYREAGYDVRLVEFGREGDVRLFKHPGRVHGILAAPPCTVFACSGNRWKRSENDYRAALSIVDACLRLVTMCEPKWWALENPVGTLRQWIGPPVMTFQPCDYGDPYTKRTCLWGRFTPPEKTPVEPTAGSRFWKRYGGSSAVTKNLRSMTPEGFARAFFDANR